MSPLRPPWPGDWLSGERVNSSASHGLQYLCSLIGFYASFHTNWQVASGMQRGMPLENDLWKYEKSFTQEWRVTCHVQRATCMPLRDRTEPFFFPSMRRVTSVTHAQTRRESQTLQVKMPLEDSEGFNIKFVELVETYQCLYDIALVEYSSKEEQDKAWNHIAQNFSSTAAECKLRWKHLRSGLTRYIKKLKGLSGQAAKPVKQFYLWDVMQFVIPYLKSRPQTGSLPPSPTCLEKEHEEPDETEVDLEANDVNEANDVHETTKEVEGPETPGQSQTQPTTLSKRGRKRIQTSIADDSFERSVSDFITKKSAQKPENPDLAFLRSILPDMAELNISQKRRFKVRVLQLLEEISNEGTYSRPSSALSTHTISSTEYSSYQQTPGSQPMCGLTMDYQDPNSYNTYGHL